MRAIAVILQRELSAYFKAPLGWVVAAVVLLLSGLLFYAEALGPAAGARLSDNVLTRFFFNVSGLVAIAAIVLSIRLLTEEIQSGSIVLLHTSPVRDRDIVLGKFFAAFAFLACITLTTLYLPLLVLVNGKVSWGHIAVGYLGLLLLGGAVLSIGLFASVLTRNSLAAAVTGGALTGGMFLLWPLATVVGPPLAGVFAGLAIHGRHFSGFQVGVLQGRRVCYFLHHLSIR